VTGLRAAVGLLTRVPVRTDARHETVGASIPWFPVVGWGVGAGVAAVYALFHPVLPGLPAAAVAVATGVVLTGALHEDGLGDVADAFGGSRDRQDALRILADPRLGTYGVIAVATSLLLRAGALASLDPWAAAAVLPAGHALSRAAVLAPAALMPAVEEGLGALYARAASARRVTAAAALSLALAGATLGPWAAAAAALAAVAAVVTTRLADRRIGGVTGDVLGAAQQGAEVAVVLLGAAIAQEGWATLPWWR
jgi:adenosylcobinamide-GDP ribazoletransferase